MHGSLRAKAHYPVERVLVFEFVLSLVLAVQTGNLLWLLLPPAILYAVAQLIAHHKLLAYGRRAIASGDYTVRPMQISIGEDWIH
jgi:hypothetical protein